jgi:hypothetical protein
MSDEKEFLESLRAAAWVFETEPRTGRFNGSIYACQAVEQFIKSRDAGAELAGPFRRIAEAFEELKQGRQPALFDKTTARARARPQSPEHKRMQNLAAVFLDVLVKLGDRRDVAAAVVARHAKKWPGMKGVEISAATVVGWRKHFSRTKDKLFKTRVEKTLEEPDPRRVVQKWLRTGPPGYWRRG